jgi:hypothetical protein
MPQEDAEYELPSEAGAEDAGTKVREGHIWHPPGGTEDRERGGVNHPLTEVPQGAIGQRNPGVNEEREQQREDDAVDRVRELPDGKLRSGGRGRDDDPLFTAGQLRAGSPKSRNQMGAGSGASLTGL